MENGSGDYFTHSQPAQLIADDEIWDLREGKPTVLIATDMPTSYIGRRREAGIEEECRAWLESWSDEIRDAAQEHGATMVSLYDVANGPNHDVDWVELGHTGSSDKYAAIWFGTPNEIGSAIVADALAGAGFEPTEMPEPRES